MKESKDITPLDNNGKPHGYWGLYLSNGELYYKGTYHHGKQHGYWEQYFHNGTLAYKGHYIDGERIGYWQYGSIKPEYYARI